MLSDVAWLSKVTKSSTVFSSFSWRWVRRLSNSSSISLSLVMLLTESCPNPHFWEQLIFVSVDTSLQATCNQWIDFEILTSCIISEAFLPSSIRGTTYLSPALIFKRSDYASVNWLQSRGAKFWQKHQLNIFWIILVYFKVEWSVIEKENDLSTFYLDLTIKKSHFVFYYFSSHPSLFTWKVMYHA